MRNFKDVYISTDISDLRHKEQIAPQLAYMLLCTSGKLSMEYGGEKRFMRKNDLLFSPASRVPSYIQPSDDFTCTIFGIELNKLDDTIYACLSEEKAWIGKMQYIMDHPIIHLTQSQTELLQAYRVLVRFYSEENTHYQKKIAFLQAQAIILELMSWVDNIMPKVKKEFPQASNTEVGVDYRRNQLYLQFLQLLNKSYAKHHDVKWYASQMNISSGYLNTVCKWTTNKSPIQIISEMVAQMAKNHLLQSSKSIKEIAFSLSFANEGSFTTFFRKQTGTTPSQYRMQYFK